MVGQRDPQEHFSMVDLDQHTDIVSFIVEGFLKFDLSTMTPIDPKMTSDQKFLDTLKEPLANDLSCTSIYKLDHLRPLHKTAGSGIIAHGILRHSTTESLRTAVNTPFPV